MINLKTTRKKQNKTQEEIAKLLGITRQTYSLIEKGEAELTLGQAVKLGEFFDIHIVEFTEDIQTNAKENNINRDKYKQIIKNFIKYGSDSDGKITKTKLAKLCYLLDFTRYYYNLNSITNLEYRKIQQGPVPDIYFTTIEELQEQEDINIKQKEKAFLISNILSSKDDLLSADEIKRIQKIAKKRKKARTKEIVDFTHKQMPRMLCDDKEIIPYNLITQEELENVY